MSLKRKGALQYSIYIRRILFVYDGRAFQLTTGVISKTRECLINRGVIMEKRRGLRIILKRAHYLSMVIANASKNPLNSFM